ncbi:hypothetical protein S245_051973 [Arachis hypogaea]
MSCKCPLRSPPLIYYDNLGAIQLVANLIFHSKSKHFAMNLSFARDHITKRGVIIKHVPGSVWMVDIFTKFVSSKLFHIIQNKLRIVDCQVLMREDDRSKQH